LDEVVTKDAPGLPLTAKIHEELGLDADLREQLGVGPHESVRVIHESGRLIALERAGETDGTAVPWDRDLVLTSDVRAFPLADLLSMIHDAGKSGFLLLANEGHEKSVFLHRGEVVFAASNQRVDRLGESLLRSGSISLEQLQKADARWQPGSRFGKVLVELGSLTPRDLWNAVKGQVEDIVRSLFSYTSGTVHFWEGEIQPDNIVRLSLPTRRLIAEGLKRRDELFRFLAHLEDPRVTLQVGETDRAQLTSSEKQLIDVIAVEAAFPAACRRAGVDPLSGARSVQLLQLVGALKVERDETGAEGMPKTVNGQDDELVREGVYDHVTLLAELAAPIVAVDGAEAVASRLRRIVSEAAPRHGAILAGLSVAPGGMLDPEEILARALRVTGDRLRVVHEALSELETYLEFELNNHPGIEGAELFLEAVEGLRAKLLG
jgi:hypothetical protein